MAMKAGARRALTNIEQRDDCGGCGRRYFAVVAVCVSVVAGR